MHGRRRSIEHEATRFVVGGTPVGDSMSCVLSEPVWKEENLL